MHGHVTPLATLTHDNDAFRKVLFTTARTQLVLMALLPDEDIGSEVHDTHDQFFRIESGSGRVKIGRASLKAGPGDGIVVPAGVRHNLTNTGKTTLRLYTLYAPPQHADQLEQATKAIADAQHRAESSAETAEAARKDMIDEGSPVATVPT